MFVFFTETELSSNGQRKSNTMISKSSTGQNNTLYANDINSTPSTDLQAPQVKVRYSIPLVYNLGLFVC